MSDNSLERQIQKMMEGLEFKPDPAVWDNLKAGLAPEKKRPVIGWRIPLLLLLIAGAGVGIWSLSHNSSSAPTAQNENTITATQESNLQNKNSAPRAASLAPGGDDNGQIKGNAANNQAQAGPVAASRTQPAAIAGNQATDGQSSNGNQPGNTPPANYMTAKNNATSFIKNKSEIGNKPLNGIQLQKNTAGFPAGIMRQEGGAQGRRHNPQLALNSSTRQPANTATNNGAEEQADPERLLERYPVDLEIEHIRQSKPLPRLQQLQQHATLAGEAGAPVITRKNKPGDQWHFMPFINGGIAKIIGDNDGGISTYQKSSDQVSYSASPGSQQVIRSVVYYNTSFKSGKAFSAGFLAERSLLGKLSLQTGLRYQYVHYSTLTSATTESIGQLSNGLYATMSNSNVHGVENYRAHYLGIPLLLHYDLIRPLGITTGIINDFTLGANKDGTSLAGAMNTWIPNAYFAFVVKIPGQSKSQWQLMPYIQYGLKTMAKQGNQRLLQPGLQLTLKL